MSDDFAEFQTIPPVTRTAHPEPPTARLLAWDVASYPPGLKEGDTKRVRYQVGTEERYYAAVVDSIAPHVGPSGRYRIMLRVPADA